MPFKLTTYQDEAASELLQDAVRLLKQAGGKKLVFKAPTGSGKTITMAEFLTRFEDDTDHPPCAFIWAAPRQLHEQSREKLERYFENSRAMECSSFEELRDRQIGENEILFFNWESIRQDGNIYIRDNEQENNLSNIIERTREAGRAVVLIIDESHFHAQAETSQNLIAAIAPNLTIEISATPVMQNPDRIVPIELEAVKAEEMIKKGVVLNEDFKNIVQRGGTEKIESALAGSTDETVLREALKKREQLTKAYRAAGIGVNPLLLIQLPDRRGQADDERQALVVRALKDKHGITVENGKLAIYLSENKENLENITKNESEVDVLIFKQAIALGWDCPRAQILVLFREWHSPVFSIQTLGRIVRVVEPTHGYYENDLLNYAYVYTNIDDIEIKEDIGRGYVVIHVADRIAGYVALKLPSVHRKRLLPRSPADGGRLRPRRATRLGTRRGRLPRAGHRPRDGLRRVQREGRRPPGRRAGGPARPAC
jgi:type III restriction enzyme